MLRVILHILLGVAVVWGCVKYLEARSIFYPAKKITFTPRSLNLAFEDVYLTTRDNIALNAWLIPHPQAAGTLLFLHGNAGNIGDRLDKAGILRGLGLNIFLIDYRGYGRSSGAPSEKGLYLDAQAAYEYLLKTKEIPAEKIILYGESLGTAVAVDLASRFPVQAIILEGAFSCGKEAGKVFYPYLPGFFFSDTFNSAQKIKYVNCPVLIMHSKTDEVIPLRLAQQLFAAAQEPKSFAELAGGHNDAFRISSKEYKEALESFLASLR